MLRDKRKRGKRNTSPITSCVRWPKVPSKRGLVGCGRGVLDEGGRKGLKWAGEVINWFVKLKVQRTWLVLQPNLIDLRLRWAGTDPAGTWWWCGEDEELIFYFVQMYPTIYELLVKEQIEQGCRWERIDKPWWENGRCKRGVEILILILMMRIGMVNGCKG